MFSEQSNTTHNCLDHCLRRACVVNRRIDLLDVHTLLYLILMTYDYYKRVWYLVGMDDTGCSWVGRPTLPNG